MVLEVLQAWGAHFFFLPRLQNMPGRLGFPACATLFAQPSVLLSALTPALVLGGPIELILIMHTASASLPVDSRENREEECSRVQWQSRSSKANSELCQQDGVGQGICSGFRVSAVGGGRRAQHLPARPCARPFQRPPACFVLCLLTALRGFLGLYCTHHHPAITQCAG